MSQRLRFMAFSLGVVASFAATVDEQQAVAATPVVLSSTDTMEKVFRDEPWTRPPAATGRPSSRPGRPKGIRSGGTSAADRRLPSARCSSIIRPPNSESGCGRRGRAASWATWFGKATIALPVIAIIPRLGRQWALIVARHPALLDIEWTTPRPATRRSDFLT